MKCNKECAKLKPKQRLEKCPLPGHICFQNESVFLRSLITFTERALGQGIRGSLLEAYYDAKKLWYEKKNVPHRFAIKILDELAKVLFGAFHATARKKNDSVHQEGSNHYIILAPLECKAVDGALNNTEEVFRGILKTSISSKYSKIVQKNAKKWTQNCVLMPQDEDKIREGYLQHVACRQSFFNIDRIIFFDWCWFTDSVKETYEILILFSKEHKFKNYGFPTRKLCLVTAQAFLHGFSKFVLTKPESSEKNEEAHGYDLTSLKKRYISEKVDSKHSVALDINIEDAISLTTPLANLWTRTRGNYSLEFFIPLVTEYREEYLKSLKKLPKETEFSVFEKVFSLLFLCKLTDGWVWFLDACQETMLRKLASNRGIDESDFVNVWNNFRFKHSGIICHMERKGLLADVVSKPEKELICNPIGYIIDARDPGTAKFFGDIELTFPGVANSSFFYFRLTGHASKSKSLAGELDPGAIVAVFRIPPNKNNPDYLKLWEYQSVFRRLAETWRIKLITLSQLRTHVERVVTDAIKKQEEEERARAIAGFSHQVGHTLGDKSGFSLLNFAWEQRESGESERPKIAEEVNDKRLVDFSASIPERELKGRLAQIHYAVKLPHVFEEFLSEGSKTPLIPTPLPLLLRRAWDNLALPILAVVKDRQKIWGSYKKNFLLEGYSREAMSPYRTRHVPSSEIIEAILFEMLWNAGRHGEFKEDYAKVIVKIVENRLDASIKIIISNACGFSNDYQNSNKRGGIEHIKAFIKYLHGLHEIHAQKMHFDCRMIQFASKRRKEDLLFWDTFLQLPFFTVESLEEEDDDI